MTKMPTAKPRERYSAATRAMYDLLCDRQPHNRETVLQVGAAAALADDYNACIAEGRRVRKSTGGLLAESAMSGARSFARNKLRIATRDRHVFPVGRDGDEVRAQADFARQWEDGLVGHRLPHPKEEQATQKFGAITYYAGLSEWEGWSYAPLRSRDVAHVRLVHALPLDDLRAAFPGWTVSESADGLVSVAAHAGAPVKQVVTEWLAANKIAHEGVRDATDVKRRDLTELPQDFLHDVIEKSLPIAHGVVSRRHGAAMEVLTGSADDAQAWVRLWVVELVATFNAGLGRPFGTWVTGQIKHKVQDLNRQINGRTASDLEIKFAKAQERLELAGRTPTQAELADEMSLTTEEMNSKRTALAQLRAIRSANTLDTAPDAPDVPVVDVRANPERDALMREQASRITMALLSSAGTQDPQTGVANLRLPLGFLITYLMEWDEWVKSDLTNLAGCPASKVSKEIDQIRGKLKAELLDLADRDVD